MTWSDFYLVCFIVGFTLSLVSFLAGAFDFHLPGLEHHGHVHVGHHVGGHHLGGSPDLPGVSPFNLSSLMAFVCWFGGAGYLLTSVWKVWSVLALGIAVVVGLAGGGLVFLFLAKVLLRADQSLRDDDYDVIGLLAQVSSSLHAGGTGEIVYTQEGTRQTCAARAEDGSLVPKGTEVVVTRFEKGIAYVRRWEDLAEEPPAGGKQQAQG